MAWQDRIKQGAYTDPVTNTRLTFQFEDVEREFDKKTSAFNFPDVDGTYIQDLGVTSRRYPLIVFFSGGNCDLEATNFETALSQKGVGLLEHPMYGTINVVPFGTIKRSDKLKTAANQVTIEVTFFETIGIIYPSSQDDPAASVLVKIEEFNSAGSELFEKTISLQSEVEKTTFKSEYLALLDNVSNSLDAIASTQDNVKKQFDEIKDSINNSIDILIGDPATLAFQTSLLIQAPARALTDIQARVNSYFDLLASIFSGSLNNSNSYYLNDFYSANYISSTLLAVVNNDFKTKSDALTQADNILTQFDNFLAWRDNEAVGLGLVDTGEAYQKLQEAVALTAGYLVDISFTLQQERIITLDRDRTVIDLVAELYGSIDDQLDFFINSNALNGSEILELPRGKTIAYYV